jgi:hypothetical protein
MALKKVLVSDGGAAMPMYGAHWEDIEVEDIAPTITSALTASAQVGVNFSYTIMATGTPPISFNATNLPSGLIVWNGVISGQPDTAAPSHNVTITATNAKGTDTQTLVMMITPASVPAPSFSAFAITGQATNITAGQSIAANPVFTWTLVNPGSIVANSISITDVTASASIATGLSTSPYTSTRAAQTSAVAFVQTFRISADVTGGGTIQRDFVVTWAAAAVHNNFWGRGQQATMGVTGSATQPLTESNILNDLVDGGSQVKAGTAGTYVIGAPGGTSDWFYFVVGTTEMTTFDVGLPAGITQKYQVMVHGNNLWVHRLGGAQGGQLTATLS